MDIYSHIYESLVHMISRCLGVHEKHVPLIRRNKNLKQGDFMLPLSGLIKLLNRQNRPPEQSNCQLHIVTALQNIVLEEEPVHIAKLYAEKGNVFFFLDHNKLFKCLLTSLCESDEQLDLQTSKAKGLAVINTVFPKCINQESGMSSLPVHYLRSAFLSQHVSQLMQANGYQVRNISHGVIVDETDLCLRLGIPTPNQESNLAQEKTEPLEKIWKAIKESIYATEECEPSNEDTTAQSDVQDDKESRLCVNLDHFLRDSILATGKEGYDKNIQQITVHSGDPIIQQLTALAKETVAWKEQKDEHHVCVHLVAREAEFWQQQVELLWQIAQPNLTRVTQQVHQVYGQVSTKSLPLISGKEFYRQRWNEMKESFIMKYGSDVQGFGWDAMISQVTSARIRFELLTTSCKCQVKLDLSERPRSVALDSCGGVFVMYNCARLARLLENFASAVQKGLYPVLPPVADVDPTLLRDDMEWHLVYNYILVYPDVVRSTVKDVLEKVPKASLHTHKICHFLQDLCRDLSSYYSKVHILQGHQIHLLPVMFARIYLLKSLQKVMHHALSLLNISPMNQL